MKIRERGNLKREGSKQEKRSDRQLVNSNMLAIRSERPEEVIICSKAQFPVITSCHLICNANLVGLLHPSGRPDLESQYGNGVAGCMHRPNMEWASR